MESTNWKAIDSTRANLSLDLVKAHLRLGDDDTTQDAYLTGLITTSLQIITDFVGDPFVDTTYEAYFATSSDTRLVLPHTTVSTIDGVFFTPDTGLVTPEDELGRDTYIQDSTGDMPAVVLNAALTASSRLSAPIVVVYVAGVSRGQEASTGAHAAYEQAQLILIADMYASPVTFSVENSSNNRVAFPAVYRMMAPYRRSLG